MKVYMIESLYVQLCMAHISQNTQGIRKIIVFVKIISFKNILSQSSNVLQWLHRVVTEGLVENDGKEDFSFESFKVKFLNIKLKNLNW